MKALRFLTLALFASLLLGSAPHTSALGKQVVTLVDPASIANLYWEADLTPIHTLQIPGKPAMVPFGWGWGYDYTATFADAPTRIEPVGLVYANGEVTGRSWSEWGIPGDVKKWQISLIAPPEYPRELTYMTPYGGVYTGKLIPGAIPVYNLIGDNLVVRSLVWVWKQDGRINAKTWQVAVGYMVPADSSVYTTEKTIPSNSKVVWSEFKGGQVSDVYLAKAAVSKNTDGWATTRWTFKSVSVKNSHGTTVVGNVNYMESTPYDSNPWYDKWLSETWDPARLIGQTLCPYSLEVPFTMYLYGGPCE